MLPDTEQENQTVILMWFAALEVFTRSSCHPAEVGLFLA